MTEHLSIQEARTLLLAAQGLIPTPDRPAVKRDVLDSIRRMHVLQIDTISVVNRSPYLVLWSRIGDYPLAWLTALLAEGALFEYWSHEACFVPMDDFPLYRRVMLDRPRSWSNPHQWIEEHPEAVERVLAHIDANGHARSSDFERTEGKSGGWWGWKDEKAALEVLYAIGELMISERHNFQRVYARRHTVMPDWDDRHAPPLQEVYHQMIRSSVKALGVTTARWIMDYFRLPKREAPGLFEEIKDTFLPVKVDNWKDPLYVHPDNLTLLKAVQAGDLHHTGTTLLSPFDPVVWDRARAQTLFDFAYRIEVYTPAPKRVYGYFVLPILHQGRLVGRLDPKAHRKTRQMEIRALHLEPGVVIDDALVHGLADALRRFAAWHGTPEVIIAQTS